MNETKIIERIKKMLALASNNPSAEEAAVAAAKAQALIEEHAIDVALLSAQEAPEEAKLQSVKEAVIYQFKGRRIIHWISTLGHGVCKASGLYSWTGWIGSKRAMKAAGPMSQIIGAEVLIDWLIGEVEQLWERHKDSHRFTLPKGKSYANSFRMGCAAEISKRLQEASETSHKEAERRASMSRDEAYLLAMKEEDTDTLASLDSGEKRYGLAIVRKAFALVKEQKVENKRWARAKYKFTSGGYGGSSRGGGWGSGVAAGKKAKITTPKRIK